MTILNNILAKLGLGKVATEPGMRANPLPPSASRPNPSFELPPTRPAEHIEPRPEVPQPEKTVPVVDVVSQLEQHAAASSRNLDWRTSIVDLLSLLDIDSRPETRRKLAKELHCPPDLLEDSARMDIWLHKTVLSRIAANGGNVPEELTD